MLELTLILVAGFLQTDVSRLGLISERMDSLSTNRRIYRPDTSSLVVGDIKVYRDHD